MEVFDGQGSVDNLDGGPGSGNWGHAGRPGERGGSAAGGGKHNRLQSREYELNGTGKPFVSMSQAYKENKQYDKEHGLNWTEAQDKRLKTIIKRVEKNGEATAADLMKAGQLVMQGRKYEGASQYLSSGLASGAEWMRNRLSKVTKMGASGIDLSGHITSHPYLKDVIEKTYEYFPSKMVKNEVEAGGLHVIDGTKTSYDSERKILMIREITPMGQHMGVQAGSMTTLLGMAYRMFDTNPTFRKNVQMAAKQAETSPQDVIDAAMWAYCTSPDEHSLFSAELMDLAMGAFVLS